MDIEIKLKAYRYSRETGLSITMKPGLIKSYVVLTIKDSLKDISVSLELPIRELQNALSKIDL